MKSQPNRNYDSNDDIQTPLALAERLVRHLRPTGHVLEPCRGDGNIFRLLPEGAEWCEIKEGLDFFDVETYKDGDYDWIITNPPWSKIRPFLLRAMEFAENVVFLMTINHLWTKARICDIDTSSFGIKQIVMCDTPKEFPQSGFQLGAVHLAEGYSGPVTLDWM